MILIHCDLTACNHNRGELCTNRAAEKTLEETGHVMCIPWITPEEKDKILCMDRPITTEDVLQAFEELPADVERRPIRVISLQEEVEGEEE